VCCHAGFECSCAYVSVVCEKKAPYANSPAKKIPTRIVPTFFFRKWMGYSGTAPHHPLCGMAGTLHQSTVTFLLYLVCHSDTLDIL
jgi:hypothetical protein